MGEHACFGAALFARATCNSQAWLLRHVPKHLLVSKKTTPREVIDSIQIYYGEEFNYQAAHQVCMSLSHNELAYERNAYQLLPSYLFRLCKYNPYLYSNLEMVPGTNSAGKSISHLHRIFISPAGAQLSFQQCRRFVVVHGTFCKARFVQTLLMAVSIDANGHIVLLAWAVVESEKKDMWEYFMFHLKHAIPQIMEATIISDRDKGLQSAEEILGPKIFRAHCCFHLYENFQTRFGIRLTELYFAKIANAKTEQAYDSNINLLRQEKPPAAEYLASIDQELWVTAFFRGRRQGHNTSNLFESCNRTLKLDRELSILKLLNEIWHTQMTVRYQRLLEASNIKNGQIFTNFCRS